LPSFDGICQGARTKLKCQQQPDSAARFRSAAHIAATHAPAAQHNTHPAGPRATSTATHRPPLLLAALAVLLATMVSVTFEVRRSFELATAKEGELRV
jgi:hypothetical protein